MGNATQQKTVELLAPAGSYEALRAAVCAGADAVYLGLGEFNARRNADNFTEEAFAQACRYAHLRGTSVYVTLNVEVLPSELQAAVSLAKKAAAAGADAFIVQDVGLAQLLAEELPEVPLHASTQMNIHNAAGVELAWRLGMERITFARELSIDEIADLTALAADFGMEVEVFAHGALCICYSGQCLMSSMIGGRSANRGLCAQACRLAYELQVEGAEADGGFAAVSTEGEHLLSPCDLCTVDMLGALAQAGVRSLKLEGRMKSADYVYAVVSVYREVLDRVLAGETDARATEAQHRQLEEAFSRGFTTAYLDGKRGNDIMSYKRPNNRGVFVGRVSAVSADVATVAAEVELHEGDVLEFWTNRGHFAQTLGADACIRPGEVACKVEQRVGKGDRVFRVRNAEASFAAGEFDPCIPVEGFVQLRIGKPAYAQFSALQPNGMHCAAVGEAWGDVVEPARTKALSREDAAAHVDRLGQTPYVLPSLEVELDEGVGMGFSTLHHLRAAALEDLTENLLAAYKTAVESTGRRDAQSLGQSCFGERATGTFASCGTRLVDDSPASAETTVSSSCQVVALATNPTCARAAKRAGADAIYVPALNYRRNQAVYAGVLQSEAEQAGYPSKCVMVLPAVDHDPVGSAREAQSEFDIWDYVHEGKPVLADSLAGCVRAAAMGALVEAGPHIPVTNAASLRMMADLGVQRVWLSPELTLGQIDDLARVSPVPLGLAIIGAQELMMCEHCVLMSEGPCAQQCATCPRRMRAHKLMDKKGFDFPVITDVLGRSHVYNGVQLDIAQVMPDLASIGISAVMVDTTLMDKRETADAVARAVRARDGKSVAKRTGTTSGHLFRGVS